MSMSLMLDDSGGKKVDSFGDIKLNRAIDAIVVAVEVILSNG